jgi:hypothetical protein
MRTASSIIGLALLPIAASSASAAILEFDLLGRAGAGLLPGNELHSVVGPAGTGGEIQTGIRFNDQTNELAIAVGWGSFFGFSGQLTGNATAMHIHGNADINSTAGVQIGLDDLPGFLPAANGGCFVGTVLLTPAQAQALLSGLLYINVHTGAAGGGQNPAGEIRGNMVLVPSPGAGALLGLGALATVRRRRTR